MENTKDRLNNLILEKINDQLSKLDYETQLSLFQYFQLANDGLTRLIGDTK